MLTATRWTLAFLILVAGLAHSTAMACYVRETVLLTLESISTYDLWLWSQEDEESEYVGEWGAGDYEAQRAESEPQNYPDWHLLPGPPAEDELE